MAQGEIGISKLVLIGGSAGSLEALLDIVSNLDSAMQIPIILVLHRKSSSDSLLSDLLSTKTKIAVKEIEDKEKVQAAHIYVAPGDYHILFEADGTVALDDSEKVNYSRPSIDVAFESAAEIYGASLCCMLLSGANSDGTNGLRYVKERKGVAIAQAPQAAEVAFMPQNAIDNRVVDYVLDNKEIANYLNRLNAEKA
ncbi:MAG: chemotaxis protein CheB [Bacteroidetes bacterium]|nr:chemotaxis protein CheB [Bacteroidota bacterium]